MAPFFININMPKPGLFNPDFTVGVKRAYISVKLSNGIKS